MPKRLRFFVPIDLSNSRPLPLVLRVAGIWLIWSAWCSAAGWLLSAMHDLDGYGYAALLPLLLAALWFWLKGAVPGAFASAHPFRKFSRRLLQPAPLVYFCIALLSLLGGALHVPWSFDAATYRLPRILYWWAEQHWYWIGTLDHRLDFSSTGFEWQMLPVIILTRTDRLLFLINWLPFLLLPGLVFVAFRALGVCGRSARRWMWLLPSAFCIALQCGGVQNDGYSVNFLLAGLAFAVIGCRTRRLGYVWMSVLAAALLTGAKISNLPLLLPLAVLLWPVLGLACRFPWKTLAVLAVALLCSAAPIAFLCWKQTGDWAGDPNDQWHVKTHGAVATSLANVTIFLKDVVQPPYLPGCSAVNAHLKGLNESAFFGWLKQAHGEFNGVYFGETVYEGGAGLGCSLVAYLVVLLCGWRWAASRMAARPRLLPWTIRLAPWLAWISYLVFLAKLGSDHSARIAAPYYPLLLVTLVRVPGVAAFERSRLAGGLAVLAAATTVPIILMMPVRPLVPVQAVARVTHCHALDKLAEQYAFWAGLRDNLAPLREQLPPDATRLGYAAGFHEVAYSLFKPLGSRALVEIGLPLGSGNPVPPDLKYAVLTERGLQERGQPDLPAWLQRTGGEIIYAHQFNTELVSHVSPRYETWYLVKFNPPATNPIAALHGSTH